MLVLAVVAGESGVNPELSRNGMKYTHWCHRKSDDLPTVRPARPNRVSIRPGLAVGPVDAARCCPVMPARARSRRTAGVPEPSEGELPP